MTAIEKFVSPTPTLDSSTSIFDTIEYLIINNCDHTFVQQDGNMIGIVSANLLLENYKSQDLSGTSIREYMGPFITIKGNAPKSQAVEIMSEHDIDCIAVTNLNGVLLGVAAFNNLGNSSSVA